MSLDPVTKSIVVDCPVSHAFDVFTNRFNLWWPRSHHIGKADLEKAIIEPREGGRWYERCVDGSECEWGKVLVWAPPGRVALAWHLTAEYAFDPDPARASRVEVTFKDDGGKTRVELVHEGFDKHANGKAVRDSVASKAGWSDIIDAFGAAATRRPAD
jgi:uncharacterized protein YndB with AHSA1/START domain